MALSLVEALQAATVAALEAEDLGGAAAVASAAADALPTNVKCRGRLRVGAVRYLCTATHGDVGVERALAESCNIFFFETARSLGLETIVDYATTLGVGIAPLAFLNSNIGSLPRRTSTDVREAFNTSVGQGRVTAKTCAKGGRQNWRRATYLRGSRPARWADDERRCLVCWLRACVGAGGDLRRAVRKCRIWHQELRRGLEASCCRLGKPRDAWLRKTTTSSVPYACACDTSGQ